MPTFKTTKNILIKKDEDELFDQNWMDKNTVTLPPKINWDYKKELKIEDVDIWEVVYEAGGFLGVYVAWSPYAEFYMITPGYDLMSKGHGIETYYGDEAGLKVFNRMKEFGVNLSLNNIWIEEDSFNSIKNINNKTLYLP